MKHLGDVSRVNGAEIEPVDVITFGSPCQDLSIAGKRAGLKHEDNGDDETTRSGLFMEAVRIIKEMRRATNGVYPAFALWENVPGAFSSNKGEDFRIVLEELIKIVEPAASVPEMPKGGWPYADCYVGDGWSLAYRTFDAQYWGVPQRRRRIHLVLDLGGERAGEILFERDGLQGYFETGRTPWKGAPGNASGGAGAADSAGECVPFHLLQDPITGTVSPCMGQGNSDSGQASIGVCYSAGFKAGNGSKARGIGWQEEQSPTLAASPSGTNQAPAVCIERHLFENHSQDARYKGPLEVCPMLPAQLGTGGNNTPIIVETGQARASILQGVCPTMNCNHEQPIVVFDKEVYNSGVNAGGGHYIQEGGPAPSLRTEHPPGVCIHYIVRRLTPTECARLQGFADRWGDIDKKDDFTEEEYRFWMDVRNTNAAINGKAVKEYTKVQMLAWYNKLPADSAKYKMWGNGIALPTALYVMQGIALALAKQTAAHEELRKGIAV